jgi:predicted RNA binding protein YcfA (HicA-like mRNA interferase family)
LKPRETVRKIERDGWQFKDQTGSHRHLLHETKPGKVTVPMHIGDLSPGVVHSILKQAGLK